MSFLVFSAFWCLGGSIKRMCIAAGLPNPMIQSHPFVFDSPHFPADNAFMPSIKQPAKKRKPLGKSGAGKISNAELLKLAGRRRPPQQWYDEEIDPTKPASGNGRGK